LRPDPDHDAVLACQELHQVVVAPPGTGKTHLSIRLAGHLADGLDPHQRVLVLTFSNQARTQLEVEAARQLTAAQRRRVEITNYHRLFYRGVLAYRRALGLPLESSLGSWKARREALRRTRLEGLAKLEQRSGVLEAVAELRFERFRDQRSPDPAAIEVLMAAVRTEHAAGRLIFEDLGALFWQLMEDCPSVGAAYRDRYRVVIADEHQDASALQDAVARRLGSGRLVVLADPMQLIHGWRGASQSRLDAHLEEAAVTHSLTTPHRWHGDIAAGVWLLAVRAQLRDETASAPRPAGFRVTTYEGGKGLNPAKAVLRFEIPRLFNAGMQTIAVLSSGNREVAELRNYLSKQGMYPRQLGGDDFEEAQLVIEQLPLLTDSATVARHALQQVQSLVPGLDRSLVEQVENRLTEDGVSFARASRAAKPLLDALTVIFSQGNVGFFEAVDRMLAACIAAGHNLPRREAAHALRRTAASLTPDAQLDDALQAFGSHTLSAAHAAPRIGRGLYVMTVHQAKGKEFDAVILCPASGRYFPDDPERRRVFYVAISRAAKAWRLLVPQDDPSPLLSFLP
jgi:superfamily I DNA/RNA helicase